MHAQYKFIKIDQNTKIDDHSYIFARSCYFRSDCTCSLLLLLTLHHWRIWCQKWETHGSSRAHACTSSCWPSDRISISCSVCVSCGNRCPSVCCEASGGACRDAGTTAACYCCCSTGHPWDDTGRDRAPGHPWDETGKQGGAIFKVFLHASPVAKMQAASHVAGTFFSLTLFAQTSKLKKKIFIFLQVTEAQNA